MDTKYPERHLGMITISIMLATIMQVVDMTIVNVALPHMQGNMSATQDQISWVLTSYIVAAAIMTPVTGVLAARFGRKRLFAGSVVGFTIASALCGWATSLDQIVIYRVLQGAVGASLVPLSQAVLLDTYPREKHGSAMALWGVGVMVGPILGPTLGGYLTEYYSWRWAFYINVPVGVLALLGILAFVPETERQPNRGFDFFGFAMLSIAIGSLQLMLDRGNSLDWFGSREIVAEAVIAALAFYMFLVHMFTAEKPFIEPALFKDRNFAAGLTLMFVVGVMLLATLALLPPFLQNLLGFPVVTAGLVLAPRGIGTMFAMLAVGRLVTRVDTRYLVLFGLTMTAISMWQMAGFNLEVGVRDIVVTGVVQGVGLGFIFVPLSTAAFATLDQRYRNEGTAMFSLIRNIGSSIGISLVVTVLGQRTQINHAGIGANLTPFRDAMHWLPRMWDLGTPMGPVALEGEVTRQAVMLAYLDDFRFMTLMTLLAVPLLLLLRPAPRRPSGGAGRPGSAPAAGPGAGSASVAAD
ncbi:MAG TPA: DHA2 family efflux MFS transporter permease subunit [Gammaproteobacteria bacterium]|nr:DHA2 family efflux MFS transporter permease subunit [Gammaproteobacteria bacterium]